MSSSQRRAGQLSYLSAWGPLLDVPVDRDGHLCGFLGAGALRGGLAGAAAKLMGLSRRRFRLEGYYQHHPHASGKVVQALLEERCGVRVSVTYLNRAQAALTRATRRGENQPGAWQDGAGGLFLLAAAAGSNLLPALRIWGCGYGSAGFPRRMCKSEDSVKQNLSNYVGESTSTFASEKGPSLADVERLKGNMRRELRNEKYPFNCTDFASPKAHGHFGYWWRSQRKGLELIN